MKAARSIFTKLFIAMIVAGIAVNLLVGAFFRYYFMPRNRELLIRTIRVYSDYIVRDIGIPPDTDRARAISERTGFALSIEGEGFSWSSADAPAMPRRSHRVQRLPDGDITWERGRFLYRKKYGPYRYLLSTRNFPAEAKELHLMLLITFLSIILGICFLLIRNILMPVRRLASGMREVSGGNLDHRVDVMSRDELGELARSFNEMRERIRLMLRSREQLLLDVSHELRSPLARIKVALECPDDAATRGSIAEDVREMERMVTEILETERLDRSGAILLREETALLPLIREAAGELQVAPEEISFTGGEDVGIQGDRRLLAMLFRNLIENALKFSGPGQGRVDVAVREVEGAAVVEVRDQGVGIPPEDLPFVFEPFFRVDRSRSKKTGGYGLGLVLCNNIARAHGGAIEIESEPGRGTLVRVNLPPGRG